MSATAPSMSSCGRSAFLYGECSMPVGVARLSSTKISSQLHLQRTTTKLLNRAHAGIVSTQQNSAAQSSVRSVGATITRELFTATTSTYGSISSTTSPMPTITPTPLPDAPQPTLPLKPQESVEAAVQELTVYEVNELDRCSPMLLSLSKLATDWPARFRVQPLGGLGDMVPFTNKIFDGTLSKRLGITAGIISVIRHYEKEDGLLFEAVYSFYFGDYGHISVKGPYKSHEDTVLTVTGGSGLFTGVYGTVQITNVDYPFVLFYRFHLCGIPPLPQALQWQTLPPAKGLRPTRTASLPGFALPNFTD